MTTIIIDDNTIEEVKTDPQSIRYDKRELKDEKERLQIRRANDKARIDEIDLILTKFPK